MVGMPRRVPIVPQPSGRYLYPLGADAAQAKAVPGLVAGGLVTVPKLKNLKAVKSLPMF